MGADRILGVARASALMLAVQVALLLAQLGYGAYTARIFDPDIFGAYAIAMAALALGSRISATGVTNAAARRSDDDPRLDRQLLGWAVLLGLALGIVVLAISGWLALLWGDETSRNMIRLIAPAIPLTAYAGALTGTLRRRGRVRFVSIATLITGITAILLGLVVVLATGEPLALTVVPVVTPALLAVVSATALGALAVPARPSSRILGDIRFSALSSANSLGLYVLNFVPLIVLSRVTGPANLGSWNRAVAFTQVPVETAMRSWAFAAFPHLSRSDRTRGWSDLTGAGLLVILPTGMAVTPAIPGLLGILLGPGWQTAQAMGAWLWAVAVVTAVSTLLVTAAESSGHFRTLLSAQVASAAVLIVAALALWRLGDWQVLAAGALLAAIAYLVGATVQAHRAGLVDGRACARWAGFGTLAGCLLAAPPLITLSLRTAWVTVVVSVAMAGLWLAVSYASRHRWAPLSGLLGTAAKEDQG